MKGLGDTLLSGYPCQDRGRGGKYWCLFKSGRMIRVPLLNECFWWMMCWTMKPLSKDWTLLFPRTAIMLLRLLEHTPPISTPHLKKMPQEVRGQRTKGLIYTYYTRKKSWSVFLLCFTNHCIFHMFLPYPFSLPYPTDFCLSAEYGILCSIFYWTTYCWSTSFTLTQFSHQAQVSALEKLLASSLHHIVKESGKSLHKRPCQLWSIYITQ